MRGPIKVLLAEDNEIYRSTLELLLDGRDKITVVGAVADGNAAVAAVAELEPHVVLMDFRLPGLDGAQATAAVRALRPDTAVICLTAEAGDDDRVAVLAAGAVALLEKGRPTDEIVDAIRSAVQGET